MKTVLIATNKLWVGGAEHVAVSQANALHEAGYNVYLGILYSTKRSGLYHCALLPSDHILHFNLKRITDLSGLLRVYRTLKRHGIEVVISHLFDANTVVRSAALAAGVETIIAYEHSTYSDKKWWQRTVDKILARRSQAIMANSERVANFTAAQEGIPIEKFHIMPQISENQLTGKFKKNRLRLALGIPEDAIVAISVGRMVSEKAQYRIIEVANELRAESRLFFVIVGYGSEEQKLRNRVRELALSHKVKIVVDPCYAKEYLVSAEIFLVTSDREGMPRAMLEGMYNGLVPIAYAVGGIPDIVVDSQNGYLIEFGDIQSMARRISSLVHDAATRERLATGAKSSAFAYGDGKEEFLALIGMFSRSQEN